jgi:hypothetical protein
MQLTIIRVALLGVALVLAPASARAQSTTEPATPAKVMLLGLFHFDNPGLDAVRYEPLDVMQPGSQAYLAELAASLAKFAPTKVLLEYPDKNDELINQRYAAYLAGTFELPRNEIYQLGFRVAHQQRHARVYGFDAASPPQTIKLWDYLAKDPATEKRLLDLIAAESARLQELHRSRSLREILILSNSAAEDRRNKGFYMLLNPVAAASREFHGADMNADWWHRNLRMYALVQQHAAPGERVLVIAGSGHTAILRDFLRADFDRVEVDVVPFL